MWLWKWNGVINIKYLELHHNHLKYLLKHGSLSPHLKVSVSRVTQGKLSS